VGVAVDLVGEDGFDVREDDDDETDDEEVATLKAV